MSRTPTDELWKVLPRNATTLERDLLRITPFDGILQPAIPSIILSKHTVIPDNWLPWLILEYGLGRLQEFIPDARQLVQEGLLFNRRIGTASAITQAAGWLDMEVELWEEPEHGLHFAEFQLKLISSVPSWTELICKLGRAIDIAKPARGRFRRLYNDRWNIDSFVLDNSQWGDILDNYSGVWGPEIGLCGGRQLWVSLGVLADLSPINSPMIEGGGLVGDFIIAEEVATSYIPPYEWPILDDEFTDPPGFSPAPMGATLHLAENGYIIDENDETIIDEEDEPLEYQTPYV